MITFDSRISLASGCLILFHPDTPRLFKCLPAPRCICLSSALICTLYRYFLANSCENHCETKRFGSSRVRHNYKLQIQSHTTLPSNRSAVSLSCTLKTHDSSTSVKAVITTAWSLGRTYCSVTTLTACIQPDSSDSSSTSPHISGMLWMLWIPFWCSVRRPQIYLFLSVMLWCSRAVQKWFDIKFSLFISWSST